MLTFKSSDVDKLYPIEKTKVCIFHLPGILTVPLVDVSSVYGWLLSTTTGCEERRPLWESVATSSSSVTHSSNSMSATCTSKAQRRWLTKAQVRRTPACLGISSVPGSTLYPCQTGQQTGPPCLSPQHGRTLPASAGPPWLWYRQAQGGWWTRPSTEALDQPPYSGSPSPEKSQKGDEMLGMGTSHWAHRLCIIIIKHLFCFCHGLSDDAGCSGVISDGDERTGGRPAGGWSHSWRRGDGILWCGNLHTQKTPFQHQNNSTFFIWRTSGWI